VSGKLLVDTYNRSKWLSSGCQLPVIQQQNVDPIRTISSVSGKWQPMTTQIRICYFTKFALNAGRGNLFEVNKIDALIGHCTCALGLCRLENSACRVGSQQHCVIGLAEVDAHLSRTDSKDSGAARVNAPAALLFVPLAAHCCRRHSGINPLLGS